MLTVAGQYQLQRLCCDDLASSLVVHHLIMFWRHTARDLKRNQCIVLKCHTTSRRRTWQEVSSSVGGRTCGSSSTQSNCWPASDPDRLAGAVSRAGLANKVVDQLDSVAQGNPGPTVFIYIVRHCPPPVLCNPTTEPGCNLAAGVIKWDGRLDR